MTFYAQEPLRSIEEASAMARANTGLAFYVAGRMFPRDRSHRREMTNDAWVEMVRAAQLYDPEREASFATYAWSCMRSRLIRLWREGRCIGHVPDHVLGAFRKIEREHPDATASEVDAMLLEAFPRTLGVDGMRWNSRAYFTFALGERSLSEVVSEGDSDGREVELIETLDDESQPDADEVEDAAHSAALAHRLLDETDLTPRERDVIALRFPMDGSEGWTLAKIGARFGVSRERIRQIEEMALRKMRRRAYALAAACDQRAA